MKKVKDWFFKNLAEQIIKLRPEYSVKETPKKRVPVSVFETTELFQSKQAEAEALENPFNGPPGTYENVY